MPQPIKFSADVIDFGPRIVRSATVVASPSAAAETIIAQLTVDRDLQVGAGILVVGFAAYTVGTSGTNVNLRIRRTNVSGTILQTTGGMTRAAAALHADDVVAFDTGATLPNQVYCMTMQVTAGAAASTVSAVELVALVF